MQVNRGTVWHTYTTQSPEYQDAEKFASDLIGTGLFLAILTPDNTFKYLIDNTSASIKLSMEFENNDNAVTVKGGGNVQETDTCSLTKLSFLNCINIRLSEKKLFHTTNNKYSENIICCKKPILIKTDEREFLLLPIVRLYRNGIAHITFIDMIERNEELTPFINEILQLPHKINHSITTSLEFARLSLLLDCSGMSLLNRMKINRATKESLAILSDNAESFEINDDKITGSYVNYTDLLDIKHNLSDISRYLIAITFNVVKKKGFKDFIFGQNLSDFYNFLQGKPSIYIFEHEDQCLSALDNYNKNRKLIYSLLGKTHFLANAKYTRDYIDYRAFDDFNFFSEQGIALTILSRGVGQEKLTGEYTEQNLMWDNQLKSELREFISFFYESKTNKIENERTHLGLAKTQEDIIKFEEWLRIFSRKYGEIQEFALNTLEAKDIKKSRHNIIEMIRAKMLVIKLTDAEINERINRKITMAFGLIASTSLSPFITKPLSNTLGINEIINKYGFKNYEDAIYFVFSLIIVWLIIKTMNLKIK